MALWQVLWLFFRLGFRAMSPYRLILLLIGFIFLILAIIGAILPLVPTTPFLILAAYFFSKASNKLHQWLLDMPFFGPSLKEWEEEKIIRKKAKLFSTGLILPMVYVIIWKVDLAPYSQYGVTIKAFAISTIALALIFIWTRKSGV